MWIPDLLVDFVEVEAGVFVVLVIRAEGEIELGCSLEVYMLGNPTPGTNQSLTMA